MSVVEQRPGVAVPPVEGGQPVDARDPEALARFLAQVPAALLPASGADYPFDIDGRPDPDRAGQAADDGAGDGYQLHLLEGARRGVAIEAAATAERERMQQGMIATMSEILVTRLADLPQAEFSEARDGLKAMDSLNISRAVRQASRIRVEARREETRQHIEHERNREQHTLNYMRAYRNGSR